MTTTDPALLTTGTVPPATLAEDIEAATRRIAPTWPLDRFIAVNPHWGYVAKPMAEAAAEITALSGAAMTADRERMLSAYREGRVQSHHLQAALAAAGSDLGVDELLAALAEPAPPATPLQLITDLVDMQRSRRHLQLWGEMVVHQISQHCAAWFDRGQAVWAADRSLGLYGSWRLRTMEDRGLPLRSGLRALRDSIRSFPEEPEAMIASALGMLGVPDRDRLPYLTALLSSVRGWAAWCSYERWQAELAGGGDGQCTELLAIRLAWEVLLVRDCGLHPRLIPWRRQLSAHGGRVAWQLRSQEPEWIFQHAAEIAWQERVADSLRREPELRAGTPDVQAVFCIDVRSERFRRHLEASGGERVQTRGFAGFFGVPIEFQPMGTDGARPQLPGLLAPAVGTTGRCCDATDDLPRRRRVRLAWNKLWGVFRNGPASMFSFVETCGLPFGWELFRRSVGWARPERVDEAGLRRDEHQRVRPDFGPDVENAQLVEIGAKALTAMGLTDGFARLVLLAGHGSSSSNNAHAAGLDCGACGGQTGEANARVLVDLLNRSLVRAGLAERGIDIPESTRFLAGLHDTTTDELQLFETGELPQSHQDDLNRLRRLLSQAGALTRSERAPSLGLAELQGDPARLEKAILRRTRDWAQVRPEWGLAGNAAFIAAPRDRTRGVDLEGRSFLHDYDWRRDEGFATLELILTAPMVVAHWINAQYNASTLDNKQFGCGNKVLHNVVGGTLGVFEGNGGDLRIGLSMQSLHDGEGWQHESLRLSVYVEAPKDAIDRVLEAHDTVRHLVENGWLHLFQLDGAARPSQRLAAGGWARPAAVQAG